jgi:hypothetical protein
MIYKLIIIRWKWMSYILICIYIYVCIYAYKYVKIPIFFLLYIYLFTHIFTYTGSHIRSVDDPVLLVWGLSGPPQSARKGLRGWSGNSIYEYTYIYINMCTCMFTCIHLYVSGRSGSFMARKDPIFEWGTRIGAR